MESNPHAQAILCVLGVLLNWWVSRKSFICLAARSCEKPEERRPPQLAVCRKHQQHLGSFSPKHERMHGVLPHGTDVNGSGVSVVCNSWLLNSRWILTEVCLLQKHLDQSWNQWICFVLWSFQKRCVPNPQKQLALKSWMHFSSLFWMAKCARAAFLIFESSRSGRERCDPIMAVSFAQCCLFLEAAIGQQTGSAASAGWGGKERPWECCGGNGVGHPWQNIPAWYPVCCCRQGSAPHRGCRVVLGWEGRSAALE